MKVEVTDDGGESWTLLEEVSQTATPWTERRYGLEGLLSLGPGIALRVTAGERPGGQRDVVIEAGLDDVVFEGTKAYCEEYTADASTPPAPVGNTLTVHRLGEHVKLEWMPCDGDASHDPAHFYKVRRGVEPGGDQEQIAETADSHHVDCDACASPQYHEYVVEAWNPAGGETP
jgi:hypothetical protein